MAQPQRQTLTLGASHKEVVEKLDGLIRSATILRNMSQRDRVAIGKIEAEIDLARKALGYSSTGAGV